MRSLAVAAAVFAASLALPAWAAQPADQGANTEATQGQEQQGSASAHHTSQGQIEQRLRHDLSKAGFTDIHVMPESFLVRAKNAEGMPVMMVVNPDSITAVTAMTPPSQTSGDHGGMSGQPGTVGSGGAGTRNAP